MTTYLSSLLLSVRAKTFTQIPLGFDKPLEMRKMPLKQIVLNNQDAHQVLNQSEISVADFGMIKNHKLDTSDQDEKAIVLPAISNALKRFFELPEDAAGKDAIIQKSKLKNHVYVTYPYEEVIDGTKIVLYLNMTLEVDDRDEHSYSYRLIKQ